MTERIIDLAQEPARLSVRNQCLRIEREGQPETTVPLAEVAVLVVSNPCVSFTSAVVAGLAQAGASLVVCDAQHMPAAMLLPLEAHFVQGERFARQAKAALIGAVMGRFVVEPALSVRREASQVEGGESRTLADMAARTAASLATVYARKARALILPEL